MKKSHFLTIAFAALAMVSCGNKNDNANNTEDSTTVEDSTIVSGVSKELQPTVAETTIEEAKQAVMSTVVSKASPEIAKIQEAGKK